MTSVNQNASILPMNNIYLKIFQTIWHKKNIHEDSLSLKVFANFSNFSCLIFVLKCDNTLKHRTTPGRQNVLIPQSSILLVLICAFSLLFEAHGGSI